MGVIFDVVFCLHMCTNPGSLVKKSKARGVKVETLRLPAVTDFSVGMYIYMYIQFLLLAMVIALVWM